MKPTSISTYKQKRQWIMFSALAVLLCVVSFFVPSKLTRASISVAIEMLESAGLWGYISIYALLLVPLTVALIASHKIKIANILISLFIVSQLDSGYSFYKLFRMEAFIYVWFFVGACGYLLLYREFKKAFLKKWTRVLLIAFVGLFTIANLFLEFELGVSEPFGIFTMFCLTLILFSASDSLAAKWYWTLFVLLAGLAVYMLTVGANCNVEFFGDMGLTNNNPLHILNECSTFYLWLAVGFVLAISVRQKIKNQRTTTE